MSEPREAPQARPVVGRHPLDPLALVAGLVAVGLALVALLDLDVDGRFVLPVLLLAGGVAGAATALRRD